MAAGAGFGPLGLRRVPGRAPARGPSRLARVAAPDHLAEQAEAVDLGADADPWLQERTGPGEDHEPPRFSTGPVEASAAIRPSGWRMAGRRRIPGPARRRGSERAGIAPPAPACRRRFRVRLKSCASCRPLSAQISAGGSRPWSIVRGRSPCRVSSKAAFVGSFSRDLLEVLEKQALMPKTAELLTNPGLSHGKKARRHPRTGDALTAEDRAVLPAGLRSPKAVLLDWRSGRILYVFNSADGRSPQIAIALDPDRSPCPEDVNFMVSACRVRMSDLRARVRGGLVEEPIGTVRE